MRLTKFPQSCVLIETNGKRILVDPGYIQYKEDYWSDIDIVLVTHKHGDHILPEAVKRLDAEIYTTKEVAEEHKLNANIVKAGDVIGFIEVVRAVHGYIPLLKGKEIHENIGFIINGEKRVYLTSDTICFPNDYKCDVIFVPVCNHGLVMGPFEAGLFAKETGASLVIPYHYDNPKFPADMDKVKEEFDKQGLNYKILEIRESIEV